MLGKFTLATACRVRRFENSTYWKSENATHARECFLLYPKVALLLSFLRIFKICLNTARHDLSKIAIINVVK
jgi:hypothetical protein